LVSVFASLLLAVFLRCIQYTITDFRNNFQDHRLPGVPVGGLRVKFATVGSLKRITERIFRITVVGNFMEASKNLDFDFSSTTLQKKF
jgi:hypothetical protein